MSPFRTILAILDPENFQSTALRRAQALAHRTGALLYLVTFDYREGYVRSGLLDPEGARRAILDHMRELRSALESMAAPLRAEGIVVHTDAIWGKPLHLEVVWKVLDVRPDLVIKDVRVEPTLKRLWHTPTDWHLLRQCPVPLMLVRPESSSYPQRIIAAIDPMHAGGKPHELNDRIVKDALALALQCDGTLHLAHAFDYLVAPVESSSLGATMGDLQSREALRATHREAFLKFARRYGVPDDRMHFVDGPPERAIAELARDINADLVVLGTVYRTGFDRVMLGSTAERIIDHLPCDLLALKPEGFAADLARELEAATHRYHDEQNVTV